MNKKLWTLEEKLDTVGYVFTEVCQKVTISKQYSFLDEQRKLQNIKIKSF